MAKIKKLINIIILLIRIIIRWIKGKPFYGVWATFEFLDDTCEAIRHLQAQGYQKIVTHSPCPRKELETALNTPHSRLPFLTFIFVGLGTLSALAMTVWMSLQWVLPVSGKAIISYHPILIITFELSILFGVLGTLLGMVLLGKLDSFRVKRPKSKLYTSYDRFTQDRFGIVVYCPGLEIDTVEEIMTQNSAEEIHRET